MQLLLTIHEFDVMPNAENTKPSGYLVRLAARAVVVNESGQVALLQVGKQNYHKLPGGGVEAGEDMEQALKRELLEEIGCEADIAAEVGEVIEYRDQWEMKQISHCYLAKQKGEQAAPSFTLEELNDGFKVIWADNIDNAIALLEKDEPANYDGKFIQQRDKTLLKAAKQLL